jgi:hypothetical protein
MSAVQVQQPRHELSGCGRPGNGRINTHEVTLVGAGTVAANALSRKLCQENHR